MNEEQLEKLLHEKKSQTFLFDKSEEEFLADFMKKTEQSSPRKIISCGTPRLLPLRQVWR